LLGFICLINIFKLMSFDLFVCWLLQLNSFFTYESMIFRHTHSCLIALSLALSPSPLSKQNTIMCVICRICSIESFWNASHTSSKYATHDYCLLFICLFVYCCCHFFTYSIFLLKSLSSFVIIIFFFRLKISCQFVIRLV